MMNLDFEDIRAYEDQDVESAINNLLKNPKFFNIVRYIFPDWEDQQISQIFSGIKTIQQFQGSIIYKTVLKIINDSTQGLTFEGLEQIDAQTGKIFLSNHRDIVLDSAFLNFLLYDNKRNTTYIAIGDNLLIYDWIVELVKLNKSFIVKRKVQKHEIIETSKKLSAYINTKVKENSSVWIAQREGRTKDGLDLTQPGIIKMFTFGSDKPLLEAISDLNIIPLSISYEFEPCDSYKALELARKNSEAGYQKTIEDDLKNMFAGIKEPKGRVHYHFGTPVNKYLDRVEAKQNKNDQIAQLTSLIDQEIIRNYKLWPNNYIAYDLVSGNDRFKEHYTDMDKQVFLEWLRKKSFQDEKFSEQIKANMIQAYANPLIAKLKLKD